MPGDGDGDDASTPCRMVHFDVIGTVRCGIPVASGEGRQVKEGFVIRREIDELEDGKGRRAFLSNIRDDIDLIEEDDVSREEDTEEGDAHDEGRDSDLSTHGSLHHRSRRQPRTGGALLLGLRFGLWRRCDIGPLNGRGRPTPDADQSGEREEDRVGEVVLEGLLGFTRGCQGDDGAEGFAFLSAEEA